MSRLKVEVHFNQTTVPLGNKDQRVKKLTCSQPSEQKFMQVLFFSVVKTQCCRIRSLNHLVTRPEKTSMTRQTFLFVCLHYSSNSFLGFFFSEAVWISFFLHRRNSIIFWCSLRKHYKLMNNLFHFFCVVNIKCRLQVHPDRYFPCSSH